VEDDLDAEPVLPARGEAQVWLRETSDVVGDPGLLDDAERTRAGSFVRDLDRDRYVAAHVMLRQLLGRHLGTPPDRLRFGRETCPCCGGPHGRPVLVGAHADRGLEFSLSHAGPLVLVALAAQPVGADVEAIPQPGVLTELGSVLHPAERAELEELAKLDADRPAGAGQDGAAAPEGFARLWTRKEAYLKGLGTGLGRAPHLDYVGTRQPGPDGWTLADVPAPVGYAAAVALRGPSARLWHR
jgi:4'-phosphopantetheinyl transferase